ncbi:cytochrome P450 [Mycena rosella]|uniref:Cytochrome P450 n=1 Tax=Mycena rosella TaxID=1033263 RepID=A0AAD7D4B0_MYCRO|nr:cytochrome P450 [Mycena rosella]
MISQLLLPIFGTLLCYVVFHLAQFLYRDFTSPLRNMVGPKSPSFLLGNFKQMADDPLSTDKWRRKFGPNFQFKGLFNVGELYTSDTKAISHIVARSGVYQKAPFGRYSVRQLFGNGILSAELDDHKRQRRVMNPAFGVAQIREMTEIFVEISLKLRDIWAAQITDDSKPRTIEVTSWLRRLTLDIIGQGGFNYQFHNMEDKPNELNEVFTRLMHSPNSQRNTGFRLAQAMVPILRFMPLPGTRLVKAARRKMFTIGRELVEQSKLVSSKTPISGRRDLLSLLLKANMAPGIPEHQRLSDEEVIGQIATVIFAGHETTRLVVCSSAIAWALHALSVNREAQTKLRQELLGVSTDNPTYEELNALGYLENVVRETMRVHSPVVSVTRMAMEDDVLPLGMPYIDKNGREHDSLLQHSRRIPKGQIMHIPILAVNTDKDIWGEDADQFKPERWEQVPDTANTVPGVWANLLTFFAGPHNCIGFRFTITEQKAILFTLIRAFEFENARPTVLADKDKTSRLPLIVKRYRGP